LGVFLFRVLEGDLEGVVFVVLALFMSYSRAFLTMD
jgi:hypothetical protein